VVTALCKLADYGHRLGVVNEKDMERLDIFIKNENRRLEKSNQELIQHKKNALQFEGIDEAAILPKVFEAANQQLKTLEDTLSEAMQEEEKARKVL
jgi:hypothetical protein